MGRINKSFAVAASLGVAALLFSGCTGRSKTGTANPYYRQGLSLRQNNEMEQAVEAFKKCLRLSPDVGEAHFQLGILYQDHLNHPVHALYHYSRFLESDYQDSDNAAVASQSISRIERKLMENWSAKHHNVIIAQTSVEELENIINRLQEQNQALEQRVANLQQSRHSQIEQTRKLIDELRARNEQLAELRPQP